MAHRHFGNCVEIVSAAILFLVGVFLALDLADDLVVGAGTVHLTAEVTGVVLALASGAFVFRAVRAVRARVDAAAPSLASARAQAVRCHGGVMRLRSRSRRLRR